MSKVIPGSDPVMYVDQDGTVRNQYFSKVPPVVCKDTGMYFVMVAGQMEYVAELVLEVHTDLEKPKRDAIIVFKDGNPANHRDIDNLSWGTKQKAKDAAPLKDIPEAGKVDSDKVKDIKTDTEEVPAEVAEEMTKKEMVIDILKLNNAFSHGQVAKKVKEKYNTKVSNAYIATVKKEIGV